MVLPSSWLWPENDVSSIVFRRWIRVSGNKVETSGKSIVRADTAGGGGTGGNVDAKTVEELGECRLIAIYSNWLHNHLVENFEVNL
jgi:hypothetical protein